ncbi:2Fe-2S iron-sulfur cluster-binding protein [Afipia sp. DC4300-2b1]|uniref:2Fe-2S iron-sulfur cluster-binding protein n=1 Tax=Afipia sp. DC4300-2b1 TaxID=2804672 RepID=UPI003CEE3C96
MARITFVQPDGSENVVNINSGTSVMLAAIRNGISGIDAECGGCLDCATCHVYIDESHSGVLAPPQPEELELLSSVAAIRKPTSRLSCQLKLPPSITALTVHIPGAQS